MTGSIIINTQHPLSLDTHVFDKDGKEHHFTYLEIRDRPDHKEGYISQAEEAIHGKDNKVTSLTYKHWSDWYEDNRCPYDYFIRDEKNIPVGRINYMIQEGYRYLSKQDIKDWTKGIDKLR